MKICPDVRSAFAAFLAHDPIFDVGEPDIVRPPVGADRDRVAAPVTRAIDQDAAHAGLRISPNVIFWRLCMPNDAAEMSGGKPLNVGPLLGKPA